MRITHTSQQGITPTEKTTKIQRNKKDKTLLQRQSESKFKDELRRILNGKVKRN